MDRPLPEQVSSLVTRAGEELPIAFVARFEDENGVVRVYLNNHGPVGDPLTDASVLADGYRYHDVLHLAFAAILGWSPVLRHLLGRKRKSQPQIDEQEDGGRARMVEEAICHVIHVRFEDAGEDWQSAIEDADFIRYVRRLAHGFEANRSSDDEWRRAVTAGLQCFNALQQNGGGIVRGDRENGALQFISKPV